MIRKTLIASTGIAATAAVLWFFGATVGSQIVAEVSGTPSARPNVTASRALSMVFVGDIMLSRSVGALMAEKNDWRWPFRAIQPVLADADIAFGNLETTISSRGTKVGSIYSFRSDPRVVEGLTWAGFDVLSVANNHIWDYGPDAFVDTLRHLAFAGIGATGGGETADAARSGVVRTVNGVRIAFLAYTNLLNPHLVATNERAGANTYDAVRVAEDIAAARQRSDIVVVSFHAGDEYQPRHNATQERLYHAAIDAGADLVVGHHPHVIQDMEQYRGKWIAYSLGNFVFDQNFSLETRTALALRVRVVDGAIRDVVPLSIRISPQYQPAVASASFTR